MNILIAQGVISFITNFICAGRLPHRPTAEPQDQDAEQDRAGLFYRTGTHHRRHRYRQDGDGVAYQV